MSAFYCSQPRCDLQWLNMPEGGKCRMCGSEMTELRPLPPGFGAPYVRGDIPEHYSNSTGCVIRSRRHLREWQRQNGAQDWEPVKEMPMTSKLKKQGLI